MGVSSVARLHEVGVWEVGWCLEDWYLTVFLFSLCLSNSHWCIDYPSIHPSSNIEHLIYAWYGE